LNSRCYGGLEGRRYGGSASFVVIRCFLRLRDAHGGRLPPLRMERDAVLLDGVFLHGRQNGGRFGRRFGGSCLLLFSPSPRSLPRGRVFL
ncbi:MAG: hypothetical protein II875_01485, partial [Clostridia bacterium]|nr:hypothetical protein [Clostridia bacterium]